MNKACVIILLFITGVVNAQYKYGKSLEDSSVIATGSKKNYLYAGIDNILKLNLPGPAEEYLLTTNNGIIFFDESGYTTIPERSGKARIIVSKKEGADTNIMGYNFFTVKNLPDPLLMIDTLVFSEKDTIMKRTLLSADSLNIIFSQDIIGSEKWLKILNYNIGYVYGGFYKSYNCQGNLINNKIKFMINNLGPGKDIIIKIFAESEGQMTKELPIYRLVLY